MNLMQDEDKWLAFDYSKTWNVEECEMLNVRVFNDCEGGNGERTEIHFDTVSNGGSEMRLDFESWGSKGPQMYGAEAGRVVLTLYGSIEAGCFINAMRKMIEAYDLRCKLGG
jgi:hypothetical protein